MKSLLLLIGLFFCAISGAQNINKPVLCSKADELRESLEKIGERVVWASPSPVEKSVYLFYGNRETGAWSLVQVVQGVGCLVAFGEAKVKGEL
jgi:hypothetical protein